jgi:hypothetical protein
MAPNVIAPCIAINHKAYPAALPLRRTPIPSSSVYPAIANPVSTAASRAGRLARMRRHGVSPSTAMAPAIRTTPAAGARVRGSSMNTAATKATTKGPTPRASG